MLAMPEIPSSSWEKDCVYPRLDQKNKKCRQLSHWAFLHGLASTDVLFSVFSVCVCVRKPGHLQSGFNRFH